MKKSNIILVVLFFLFLTLALLFLRNPTTEYNGFSCAGNASSFLVWYKDNYEEIKNLQNKIVQTDNINFYKINEIDSESYLNKLRSSGLVSEVLLDKFNKYFLSLNEEYKNNREDDGVPTGFDFDFLAGGQGENLLIDRIPGFKLEISEKNKEYQLITIDDYLTYQFNNSCELENIGFGDYFYLNK